MKGIATIITNEEVLDVPVNCMIYRSNNYIYNGFPENPAEVKSNILYPFNQIKSIEVEPGGGKAIITLINDRATTFEASENNSIIAQTENEYHQIEMKNIKRIDFDHKEILQFDIDLATIVPSSGESFIAPLSSIMLGENIFYNASGAKWGSGLRLAIGNTIDLSIIRKIEIHKL